MQVGKRGGERSDTRGRDLSARDSIHSTTFGSVGIANRLVRQEMSRTPSYTTQYFYLTGQLARTSIMPAKPTYRKPLRVFSLSLTFTNENTRTPGTYRSTNDSVMKSKQISLVRGSDLPKCRSAHTSVGDMWRGPARRLTRNISSLGNYMTRHTGRAEWITNYLRRTQTGSR